MREIVVRTGNAPAVLIVLEHEAPARLLAFGNARERAVLLGDLAAGAWPGLVPVLATALDERPRADRWSRELRAEGGGIVSQVEGLAGAYLELLRRPEP